MTDKEKNSEMRSDYERFKGTKYAMPDAEAVRFHTEEEIIRMRDFYHNLKRRMR